MNDTENSNSAPRSKSTINYSTNQDYGITVELATKALELAHTHQTAPVPKTFEVWYSYAAGGDKDVNDRVDQIITENSAFSPYDIDLIHSEFLSPNGAEQASNDVANAKLEKEMTAIISLMQSHIESGSDFSGALDKSSKNLSQAESPTQIRKIVEFLIEENTKMKDKAMNLNSNLEKSRVQIHTMRSELKESQKNEMRDALTNISNRRWFEKNLAKEMAMAREDNTPMCLVLIDLDHFKRVNDTYGHVIGDQVLRFFGSLLTKCLKGNDTIARYGGEEFAVVLPRTKVADAVTLIETVRAQLESAKLSLTKSKKSIGTVTASFGITLLLDSDDPETLVQRADYRLYEAKNSGRSRVIGDDESKSS
ncbi:MAG: diguanylate cyclase [Rhizobiaceae bacterium]|nr:diguanylate cyclase [Rhizobiaceae bacterium]